MTRTVAELVKAAAYVDPGVYALDVTAEEMVEIATHLEQLRRALDQRAFERDEPANPRRAPKLDLRVVRDAS